MVGAIIGYYMPSINLGDYIGPMKREKPQKSFEQREILL